MKKYSKLPIPSDSAWNRKTWRRYAHWRVKEFVSGVNNLVSWFPIVWKDRHWDDYYITKVLQKKIELQREYLVNANRHTNIDRDNFWMTVVLNLIEREHEEYYALEKYDYVDQDMVFTESKDRPGSMELNLVTRSENLDAYLAKYPASVRKVKLMHPDKDFSDKNVLSLYVASYNQKKCRDLIFEIMKRYSACWWD